MILSAIAAMARNRVIGKNNRLPWHISEELKFFKEKTNGKVLIMGRKTFESLPGALPNRFHIVISSQKNYQRPEHLKISDDMWTLASSLEEAISKAKSRVSESEEVFVCGGGEIYKQSFPLLDRLYLSVIDQDYDGDAFFPEFDPTQFSSVHQDPRPGFTIFTYQVQRTCKRGSSGRGEDCVGRPALCRSLHKDR
jgi:dihydrofolate reductase